MQVYCANHAFHRQIRRGSKVRLADRHWRLTNLGGCLTLTRCRGWSSRWQPGAQKWRDELRKQNGGIVDVKFCATIRRRTDECHFFHQKKLRETVPAETEAVTSRWPLRVCGCQSRELHRFALNKKVSRGHRMSESRDLTGFDRTKTALSAGYCVVQANRIRTDTRRFCCLKFAYLEPVWKMVQATSNSPAAPMPPPTHMVTTTYFTLRRLPSINACPTMREPLIP